MELRNDSWRLGRFFVILNACHRFHFDLDDFRYVNDLKFESVPGPHFAAIPINSDRPSRGISQHFTGKS